MKIQNLSDTELVILFSRLDLKLTKDAIYKGAVSQKTKKDYTKTIEEMAKRFKLDYDILVAELNN